KFVCISIAFGNDHGDDDSSGGIASVYAIAQQHCGWLETNRDPCHNTSFDLYLPVARPDNGTAVVTAKKVVEISGGHETILLVEDELDLLALTRDILQRYGYRII